MEFWDAYDNNLNKIEGMTLVRGEVVPDGVFHIIVHVLAKHKDGDFLLMRRDPNKKYFPNLWDGSASGSLLKGEKPEDGVIRELKEETGIIANDLTFITSEVHPEYHVIYFLYVCVTNVNKNDIVLQKEETVAYKWVDKETFLKTTNVEPLTKRMQQFIIDGTIKYAS